MPAHDHQEIVKIVRNAPGQLPERLHLLRLRKLFLRPRERRLSLPPLRDVACDFGVADQRAPLVADRFDDHIGPEQASVVIEAIRDEGGTLVGYAKITRDITERREAQAALARAQEQLAQSQKMEALGQLTGSIAHDFNNLLMIVSGHAQILRRRLSDPKHLQAIEALHSAVSRGESLTRQLLAFSRRQPLSPVVVNLKERVEAVREMLIGALRGNVELKCDLAADIWPV